MGQVLQATCSPVLGGYTGSQAARGTRAQGSRTLNCRLLMNFDEQDRLLRSLMARASSPCCGQARSLFYHFLVGSRNTDFVRQISSGSLAASTFITTRFTRTGLAMFLTACSPRYS